MKPLSLLLFACAFLASAAVLLAVRPEPQMDLGYGYGYDPGFGFPGPPFGIPGFGGGYGGGFGGPYGGRSAHGIVKASVVCSQKGPCYKKRVTCPDRCYTSYSHAGKGYGYGGGGGGCSIDCQKTCTAYC